MQATLVAVLGALMFWIFGPEITRDRADDKYDFIIVGAGTAGSVVASKLSNEFSVKVLLLEAGDSDLTEPRIFIPGKWLSLRDSHVDWNYTTASQDNTFFSEPERTKPYRQGKVLGGSSSVNVMLYIRGSPHDFDSWEDHGAKGWNYKSVERNFRNVEYARGRYMPKSLGGNGKVKLSHTVFPESPLTRLVDGIASSFGFKIRNYNDHIEGFSYAFLTVYGMFRQNSVISFLRSALPNSQRQLHVVTKAHVTKILVDQELRTYGVRYYKDGQNFTAFAEKEVVLSAGAFGTPKLLMLSGIGLKEELKKFNISLVVESPGVGSNLDDHIFVKNVFQTDIKFPGAQSMDPKVEYLMYGKGPLIDVEHFYHVTKSKYFNTTKSASNYKRPFPDILSILRKTRSNDGNLTLNVFVTLAHGKSRGTVRLSSSDPLSPPIIDHKFYSDPDDIDVHIAGLQLMEKYETSEAMVAVRGRLIPPVDCEGYFTRHIPRSTEFYQCLTKYAAVNMHHASGTAKMGSPEDSMAVVDHKLRVYGVKKLRIADASVMPHVTTANTMSPCYMIGDKAAEMIMGDWPEDFGDE